MPQWSTENLLAWMEQAFVLASAGSLLLIVFRIRHARTKLAYCHTLLAICLLLPLLQPWKHPIVVREAPSTADAAPVIATASTAGQTPAPAPTPLPASTIAASPTPSKSQWPQIPEGRLILWLLTAGVAVKLCWLLGGLWRIRKYRIASMPLYPIPESVRAAAAVTQTDALFCISSDVPGPVMLGWLTPVVLLPESFLTLGEEAQCGIACHELLHVRRHDWLVTLLEELTGTLLWFNPGIWPLLAQTRLAREQLVDAEVVRLTSAREPYIDALLAIARGGQHLDLAPAPLFLRRRHLTQRVHSLLKDASASTLNLVSSYASITAMLALTGWFGFTSFPLIGQSVFQEAPRQAALNPPQPQIEIATPPASAASPNPRPAVLPQVDIAGLPSTPPGYIPSVPVPQDPHELVSAGPVRTLSSPSDRAAAFALLSRAQQNAQLHTAGTPPFRFDVSFTAFGDVMQTGPGQLTEIRLSGQRWRWTADLGGFSVIRLAFGGRTIEDHPVTQVPMRVQSLRNAILWTIREGTSRAQIRAASITWNGKPATCLLLSNMAGEATLTQARLWEEDEYCIDNASGLLQMYSIAPGTYTVYGYSRHLQFHGESFADRLTMYAAGVMTADADFTIADASPADESLLMPTSEMLANNATVIDGGPSRFQIRTPNPLPSKLVQPVIVHATVDRSGGVVEEELSAAADPALAQAALDLVKQGTYSLAGSEQRQAYINVRFMPR